MATDSTIAQKIFSELNPAQKEAVLHFRGPILVLAGAGSGKTRVLTRRIGHLVLGHSVPPERILAVTFTNKATEEMRGRLSDLLGTAAERLWVATFHSACLRILRRQATQLGFTNDFVVYDDQDTKSLLKQVIKEEGIDEKKFSPQLFSKAIDEAKNELIRPENFIRWQKVRAKGFFRGSEEEAEYVLRLKSAVYASYQKGLERSNAMDFGDLIMKVVELFKAFPEILGWYQNQIEFLLVDEFQDTNLAQYELVRLLSEKSKNVLVVGDDDQSIYAFRGATVRNILEFEKNFPGCKVVTLDQNYRSTGNILEASHAVIKQNASRKEKKLWTASGAGNLVKRFVGSDELEEAQFVANMILELSAEDRNFSDKAIFYRTNAQSRAFEEALLARKIPYRIFGGLKFYERKEIKDIIAYLRIIANPQDNQAFLRVVNTPPRGIGAQTVQAIVREAKTQQLSCLEIARRLGAKNKNVAQFAALIGEFEKSSETYLLSSLIGKIIEDTQYLSRLKEAEDPNAVNRIENLKELESAARSMEGASYNPREALRAFLDKVSLTSSSDGNSAEGDVDRASNGGAKHTGSVSLMTLHLAKGLEFKTVFLTGCEEGLLPHYRAAELEEDLEEERRLCYVGMTRAMRNLYVTRALSRGLFAGDSWGYSSFYRDPSRFIQEVPEELFEDTVLSFDAIDPVAEESF